MPTFFDPAAEPDGPISGWLNIADDNFGKDQDAVPNKFCVLGTDNNYAGFAISKDIWATSLGSREDCYAVYNDVLLGETAGFIFNANSTGTSWETFRLGAGDWVHENEAGAIAFDFGATHGLTSTSVFSCIIDATTASAVKVYLNGVLYLTLGNGGRTGLYMGTNAGRGNHFGVIQFGPGGEVPAADPDVGLVLGSELSRIGAGYLGALDTSNIVAELASVNSSALGVGSLVEAPQSTAETSAVSSDSTTLIDSATEGTAALGTAFAPGSSASFGSTQADATVVGIDASGSIEPISGEALAEGAAYSTYSSPVPLTAEATAEAYSATVGALNVSAQTASTNSTAYNASIIVQLSVELSSLAINAIPPANITETGSGFFVYPDTASISIVARQPRVVGARHTIAAAIVAHLEITEVVHSITFDKTVSAITQAG